MFSSRRAGGQGFTGGYNGNATQSQLTENKSVASVAQLVEQLTLNQLVLGSSPSRGTISSSPSHFSFRFAGPVFRMPAVLIQVQIPRFDAVLVFR